jgi:hypothetical protein
MASPRPQTRRPRRPPARVFWVRRVAVLGTAFLLVFALGRLLVGSSDGSDSGPLDAGAVQAGATLGPTDASTGPEIQVPKGTKKPRTSRPPKPTPTPLAQPSGPCSPEDVAVTPEVRDPIGGGDVVVALLFRTLVTPACTFDVAARSVMLTITSGSDFIWSSRHCPGSIPTTNVVARKDVATYVYVTWDAKRSDATCSRLTDWAMPGWYHVRVAVLGGEPADEQFELARPTAGTITKTVTPKPTQPTKKPKPGGDAR